jgi:integrase
MTESDAIENWLNTVAFSHSNSEYTRVNYKHHFQRFLDHAGTTAEQIIADYENSDDKKFKRKYTPLIMSLIGKMQSEEFSPSTQQGTINTIKSFFRYNSLPLNFIPSGRQYTVFHNRDITKEEIEEIIKISKPREKAYYALMVQSGLRPNEISNLKIGDFENLLSENPPIPCKITIRQDKTKGKYRPYFTFTGEESINYIKEYLRRDNRPMATEDDFLFTMEDGKTKTDTDLISHIFRRTVRKLKKQNVLDFKNIKEKKANRNELRLYNLRKYFRNHAGAAGTDYVNFWMGHSLGVDGHYFSQTDTETHRKQYTEKAMLNLKIETKTPNQTMESITKLETENRELKNRLREIESKINENENMKSDFATMMEMMEIISPYLVELYKKHLEEHPEQRLALEKKAERLQSSLFKKKEQQTHKD